MRRGNTLEDNEMTAPGMRWSILDAAGYRWSMDAEEEDYS